MDFPDDVDAILLAMRRLSHRNWTPERQARWSRPELQQLLEEEAEDGSAVPTLHRQWGPLRAILEAGEVRRWPGGPYTEYQAVLPMNLREIVHKAEERQDPTLSVRRGAMGSRPEDRQRDHLTPSQFSKARTAARKIGARFNPDDPDEGMEEVDREYFVWDREGGTGECGDWTKALQLLEQACADQGVTAKTTESYKGSLKRVLDLAATREWIPRTEFHNPDWEPLPPEWSDLYEEWRQVGVNADLRGARGTVLMLLRELSSIGVEDPRAAPWEDVIGQLETRFEVEGMAARERTTVRRAYRALRTAGKINGPDWNPRKVRIQNSPRIVRATDCEEVGKLYGRDGHRTGVTAALNGKNLPWPERWRQFTALVEGEYGLRRFALHSGATPQEHDQLGLPERTKRPQRPETIKAKLLQVAELAGVTENEFEVDWAEQDLRMLFRREHLEAYYRYIRKETDASASTNQHRLVLLGTVVGDFLLQLAKLRGDRELKEQFRYVYNIMYGEGVEGRSSWVDHLGAEPDGGKEAAEVMKATSLRVERTWTDRRRAADFAYDQMRTVGERALQLLVENYGPLETQLLAVNEGRSTTEVGRIGVLDRTWAKAVRNTLLVWDQLVVPYRSKALAEMDLADRLHGPDFSRISARVHKWKRKAPNAEWHEPNYRKDPDSPYPNLLYALHVTEGGAREKLLTRADGTIWTPDPSNRDHLRKPEEEDGSEGVSREPFYPNRLTVSTYARMDRLGVARGIKAVVREILERWPEALDGVTYEELNAADGVLTPHAFRHALAKWMLIAPDLTEDERKGRRLDAVCNVLDHSDWQMVWEVYAGTSEADYDIGSMTNNSEAPRSENRSDDASEEPKPRQVREEEVQEYVADLSDEERMALIAQLANGGSEATAATTDGDE